MRTVRYLTATPRKPRSDGLLVVHNQVRPAEELGLRGFRAWLAEPEGDEYEVEPCSCGWAPEAGTHYRVVRPGDA